MAELFENFKDIDLPAARKKAMASGLKEGLKKGLAQGLEQGLAQGLEQGLEQGLAQGLEQGETRLASLILTLMQSDRMNDIEKVLADPVYRKELYHQYHI